MTSESAGRAGSSVAAPGGAGRASGSPDPEALAAAVIGFDRVSKQYRGGRLALDDVTLSLPAGGSLGLVGESGSGKTTCVRLALGLERPTSGELIFNGTAYPAGRARLRSLRRQIGFVLQDPYDSLDPRMTIRDIVTEPLRIHRLPGGRGARGDVLVAGQLAAVGLPGADLRSYPARYSGGGRQRIAIARALISSPSVLVCDEPTSSLDVSVQSQIVNLLLDAGRERDLSMLFVTHDLDLIGRVVDTVAVMYGGRVVETGPAELIRQSPRHPYTKALHDAVPANHPRDRRLARRGAGPLGPGELGPGEPGPGEPGPGDAAEPGADVTDDPGEPGAGPAAGGASLFRPDSCVFASRCPRAQARCHRERPPTIQEDALRSYACFYPI
ncbi:MAG TPA: ATP-binding cassette domain-containing protein [Streptosporangiaceae bacterium]|nr:ATP-binding cassette domain-containing protein [Streptosporangiaceae bacterium]